MKAMIDLFSTYKSIKLIAMSVLVTLLLAYQASAYAAAEIHFSKYRFVFDDGHRKDSLMLSNRGITGANCAMSTVDFIMNEQGPTKLADSATDVNNSATHLLRFSPRRVTIGPNNSQTVRITSRRKPNIANGEYVSYLKIACKEQANPNQEQSAKIAIQANLNYYIPLQIRVGKLSASSYFNQFTVDNTAARYTITTTQIRGGNRSVVGDIQIIEKKSGDKIGQLNNQVIYVPFKQKTHKISLDKKPEGPLELVFNESLIYRGDITVRTDIN